MAKKIIKKKISSRKSTAKTKTAIRITKPVFSGPDVLPFLDKALSWSKFERFSRHFLELLYPRSSISLYGRAGNKQKGIDLLVQDSKSALAIVQCKQYSKYSLSNFRAAKKALKVKAKKKILFLACEADVKLRDEVLRDPSWEVWDCNDLTSKVMQLESEKRFQLIKAYFGIDWAKAFSNHQEYSPFASAIDFFKHQLIKEKIFNHCGPFFGRSSDLKKLSGFISNQSQKAFILSGVGGVGKSRLTWELHKEARKNKWDVICVREGMAPGREDFQKLTRKKYVFVFDDAHRLTHLNNYFSLLLQADFDFKIVISTRPQGKERIRLDLRQLNFEDKEIQELTLNPINTKDSKSLVIRLLPGLPIEHTILLARIVKDSLLIGVMACNLIKQKELILGKISNELDIRDQALYKFKEEVLGKLTADSDHKLNRSLLETISAFSPINISRTQDIQKLSALIGASEEEFIRCLAELEAYGLIATRGDQIRITPDILSDCILEETCFLKNGKSSGYFTKAFSIDVDYLRINLLRNIAELDWRKKEAGTANSTLLKEFWENLLSNISSATIYQRTAVLSMIEPIAYYQPQDSLNIVKSLLAAKKGIEDEENKWHYRSYVESISKIIRDIIISGIQVNEAVTLLWNLGKGDTRNLNPHPDHPIRVLKDLCSYSRNMSIVHYDRILESLTLLIEQYDENDFHNPIEILSGLLEKTAHSTHSEGNKFVMTPFHISPEKTAKIRNRIYSILKQKLLSSRLKEANASVDVLENALRAPSPIFGLKISSKQVEQWDTEIEKAFDILIAEYPIVSAPLIRLEIRRVLRHFYKYGAKKKYHKILEKFFSKNPLSEEEEFHLVCQTYNYDNLITETDFDNFEQRTKDIQEFVRRIAEALIVKYPQERSLVKKINKISSDFISIKGNAYLGNFAECLSKRKNSDNEKMCLALLGENSKYLEGSFATFLYEVANEDLNKAFNITDQAISLGNLTIVSSIAGGFWQIFGNHLNSKKVNDLYDLFLLHDEESVRNQALWAIRTLNQRKEYVLTKELLSKAKVLTGINAKNLLSLIDDKYGIPTEEVSDQLICLLLDKIKNVGSLEGHEIEGFIQLCSKRIPEALVDFLIYRVVAERPESGESYYAIPHSGFKGGIRLNLDDQKVRSILEKILNCLLEAKGSETFWLPKLFYEIAKNNLDTSLELITGWIKSGNKSKIEITCDLIGDLSHHIVVTKVDWVSELLIYSSSLDSEESKLIRSSLYTLAVIFERSGTAGEPMPQDLSLVENAKRIQSEVTHPLVKDFYKDLEEYGLREIERSKKEFEKRFGED